MSFLDQDFLLTNDMARRLYHEAAAEMPIYDYHCHLVPADIAANRAYKNLHEIWLEGDHYKWRAMRANGIDEELITGNADPYDKFLAWSKTVPVTLRNPLYQWSHLELQRYFGIDIPLNAQSAPEIWDECGRQLASLNTHAILDRFKVAVVCTTDDPVDTLQPHATCRELPFQTKVYPAFRPDRVFPLSDLAVWNRYVDNLAETSRVDCDTLESLVQAIEFHHGRFHAAGCRLADHGFTHLPDVSPDVNAASAAFDRARGGGDLALAERNQLTMYLLHQTGRMDTERDWTKQLHLGPVRNLNTRMFAAQGADLGFDSIGDFRQGPGLCRFLGELDRQGHLPRTILYNINPVDNYLFASMIGNFQCGPTAGKLQFGSGWWYLDQKDGIRWQINALSNMGLLPLFVGMLTDSRSMMSYPRHEYFRRVLCQLIGEDTVSGELPHDFEMLAKMVRDICFDNAARYFNLELGSKYAGAEAEAEAEA